MDSGSGVGAEAWGLASGDVDDTIGGSADPAQSADPADPAHPAQPPATGGCAPQAERRRRVRIPRASSPTMNTAMISTSNPMLGSGEAATSFTASTA